MKPERNDRCPCGSGKKYKKCCAAVGSAARPGAHNFERAVSLFHAGRLDDALAACTAILQDQPTHAGALELMGMIHHGSGEYVLASQFLKRALFVNPSNASTHTNLAHVLCSLRELDEAEASAQGALVLDAQNADAHNILGNVLVARGAWSEAAVQYRLALARNPSHPYFHHNLGHALQQAGDEGAETAYRKAIAIDPQFSPAYANLGGLLVKKDRCEEALEVLHRAIALDIENIDAYNNLGLASRMLGDLSGASRYYLRALDRNPNVAGTWHNLGLLYEEGNKRTDAAACYKRATELDADSVDAQRDWLRLLLAQGDLDTAQSVADKLLANPGVPAAVLPVVIDAMGKMANFQGRAQAIEQFRRLTQAGRYPPRALTALLMSLHYPGNFDESELHALHLAWGVAVGQAFGDKPYTSWSIPEVGEPLRIGYLSPDFRRHSVGYFIQPLLVHHDRRHFEVYCYANQRTRDEVTEAIDRSVARYTEVRDLTDAQLAQRIHADGIHILVDLAGHSAETRLDVLALRPAPVQITYLGYPNTTGLRTVDYRISDPHADRQDADVGPETLLRLPESFLCFGDFNERPLRPNAPCREKGFVTFGSFNNLSKLTPQMIQRWSEILNAVPASRLLIKANGATSACARANLEKEFGQHSVDPKRLVLVDRLARTDDHLDYYGHVDIALDTFPYHGATTTCEALWMGVPVVTQVGDAHRSRVGMSLLTNVGLTDGIARNAEEYVQLAIGLARDPDRLDRLRSQIPQALRRSILCQPQRFTRQFESVLRAAWDGYRARNRPSSGHED